MDMAGAINSAMKVAQAAEVYEPVAVKKACLWADGPPRIGIHTSIAGDCVQALEIAHGLGCTALQIFSNSPRMWPRPGRSGFSPEKAAEFRARRTALRLGPLAIHANYLINLASGDAGLRTRSVAAFRDELIRGMALGADYLIL